MPLTPSNIFNVPLTLMSALLCNTTAWQTFTGTDNATDAADYVGLWDRDISEETNPQCIIDLGEAFESTLVGGATQYQERGNVTLWFEAAIPDAYPDWNESLVWMANQVGGVIEGMKTISGTDGYVPVRSFRPVMGPARSAEKRTDARLVMVIECEIG